jgi:predicted Zn-dependent protease with MMP-like domain
MTDDQRDAANGDVSFWRQRLAPTLAEFEALADEAYQRLPDTFRELSKGIIIRVAEFAEDDVLKSLGIEDPFELMGLYHGVSLDRKSVNDVAPMPDLVFLYRRAILDYWADGDETLGHLITHVLVHEIGHHFGLSDADMEAIEAGARG